MSMISELQPNRRLIDDNFSSYFLSLSPIPSYCVTLNSDVDQVFASDEQYSYLHSKLFSLHNHLFYDPWLKNSLYFIDSNWKVQKCVTNENTDVLEKIGDVWEIPSNHSRIPGHFPITMVFPDQELVVLTDGAGTLHVVSREANKWQLRYGEEVIGKEKSFLISDCRCEKDVVQRVLHVILLYLETTTIKNSTDSDTKEKSVTYLEWVTLIEESSGGWSLSCVRQLKGNGLPEYVALESSCKSIYIANEHAFEFVYDTENPFVKKEEKKESKRDKIYIWQQNCEEIKVWFALEDGMTTQEIKVDAKELKFSIQYKNKVVFEGDLFHNIDRDLTTWIIENNRLNIILQKVEQGLIWKEFINGNKQGEEVLDDSIVQQVHERLSHLCSDTEVERSELYGSTPAFNMEQLEDCDNFGESKSLVRFDRSSHSITHQYSLAGHQWLFSVKATSCNNTQLFCIRHDVHGCLWQPEPPSSEDATKWPCTHICTFPAFGYVHASKQNRKFSLCSPDLTYTVICESNNHIYIYYKDTTNDLRNRKGSGRTQAGKLSCIKIESGDPILGASSTGNHLFILTKSKIYQYHIMDQ